MFIEINRKIQKANKKHYLKSYHSEMTTRGYNNNNKALTTNIFSIILNAQVLLASSQLVLGSRNYDTKIIIRESGSGQISAPHMKLSSGKGGGPGETITLEFL